MLSFVLFVVAFIALQFVVAGLCYLFGRRDERRIWVTSNRDARVVYERTGPNPQDRAGGSGVWIEPIDAPGIVRVGVGPDETVRVFVIHK